MRKLLSIIVLLAIVLSVEAQNSKVKNKPYIDLRPFHFGVVVGMHLQDIKMLNVGPQLIMSDDGTTVEKVITCDQDRWDPGFTVGVLGECRLSDNFAFRISPAMYFGNKHITFINMTDHLENGQPITQNQDMKNVYISAALDLLFSAPRYNNVRPYIVCGLNPMMNLSGKDSDYLKLKGYDVFFEIGLGNSFYLPFFKFRTELKFCYGLINSLDTGHADRLKDANMKMYATSVKEAHSKMVVLSFYFE
ncbi:MAG: PorT family protein [Prevotella sp.]|nr:PorT family protein [Prevotella sp.]